jgi:tetratricopeptide (TPR) repeat protein
MIVLLVGALPLAGNAQTGSARQHFTSGTKHFDLGEYQEALTEFKEAYRIKEDPVFLYNIAQCYRLLKNNTEAIHFYQRYLRRAPDAPNRTEVEHKISALEDAQAAQQRAATAPPQAVLVPSHNATPEGAPPSEPREAVTAAPVPDQVVITTAPTPSQRPTPLYKKWWLWTAVGGALAAAVVIGVAVGVTQSREPSSPFSGVTF